MTLATRSVLRITTLALLLGALMLPTRSHAIIISECGGPVAGICGGECAVGNVCANVAGSCQCVNSSTFCSNQAVGTDQAPMCGGFCPSQFTTCQLTEGMCLCLGNATPTPTTTATPTPTLTEVPVSPSPSVSESPSPSATPTATETATTTATPTVLATAVPPGVLDHLHCYEAQSGPFTRRTVDLQDDDQFAGDATGVKVRKPRRLCNPVSKNGEDPTASTHTTHFVGYPIRHPSKVRDLPKRFAVTNQFHDATKPLSVDFIRPELLLVPSLKNIGDPAPGTPPANVDHYECYRVKRTRFRLDPSTLPNDSLDLLDQFNPSPTDPTVVTIKRPRHLCVPVIKNDEAPLINPNDLLLCYELRLASNDKPYEAAGPVHTNNQFGTDQVFGSFRTRELCVPSLAATTVTTPCGLTEDICSGDCPNQGDQCLFVPSRGGGNNCQCVPESEACGDDGKVCGGLCPNPNHTCFDIKGCACFGID